MKSHLIFLFVYFSIYGGLHLYALLKLKQAFKFGPGLTALAGLPMAAMVAAPLIIRLAERRGFEFFARSAAYIGYTWMSIIFLSVCTALALDVYRLSVFCAGKVWGAKVAGISISPRALWLIASLVGVVGTAYGAVQAVNIRSEHVTIQTPKISQAVGRLRIVQISDIHLGLIVRESRLRKIVAQVKAARADILVSTGDLFDGQLDRVDQLAGLLREIDTPYGKFAVTGNHEVYAGLERALAFTQQAGFTVLRGSGVIIDGRLNIAGVDDDMVHRRGLGKPVAEKELLSGFSPQAFTLLLKHRPLVDQGAQGLFDLQLSGHTHKGQIFPFSLITRLYFPHHTGLIKLTPEAGLYVSRGSGTWGPPVRLGSPPEVTVIDLVASKRRAAAP